MYWTDFIFQMDVEKKKSFFLFNLLLVSVLYHTFTEFYIYSLLNFITFPNIYLTLNESEIFINYNYIISRCLHIGHVDGATSAISRIIGMVYLVTPLHDCYLGFFFIFGKYIITRTLNILIKIKHFLLLFVLEITVRMHLYVEKNIYFEIHVGFMDVNSRG